MDGELDAAMTDKKPVFISQGNNYNRLIHIKQLIKIVDNVEVELLHLKKKHIEKLEEYKEKNRRFQIIMNE